MLYILERGFPINDAVAALLPVQPNAKPQLIKWPVNLGADWGRVGTNDSAFIFGFVHSGRL